MNSLLFISTSPSLFGPGMASACRYWHYYYYYYHRHQAHSSGPWPQHWPRLTAAPESWRLSMPGTSPVISTHVSQDQRTLPFVHRSEIYKHSWRFTNRAPTKWHPRSKSAEWLPLLSRHKWRILIIRVMGNVLNLQLAATDATDSTDVSNWLVSLTVKCHDVVKWRGSRNCDGSQMDFTHSDPESNNLLQFWY